jgi:hypothetical protein
MPNESEGIFVSEEATLMVKFGANWLDQSYPEWLGLISLEHLDIKNPWYCIMGQLVRDGEDQRESGWRIFTDFMDENHRWLDWASDRGFAVGIHLSNVPITEAWEELNEAWRREILERRYG